MLLYKCLCVARFGLRLRHPKRLFYGHTTATLYHPFCRVPNPSYLQSNPPILNVAVDSHSFEKILSLSLETERERAAFAIIFEHKNKRILIFFLIQFQFINSINFFLFNCNFFSTMKKSMKEFHYFSSLFSETMERLFVDDLFLSSFYLEVEHCWIFFCSNSPLWILI